jgi:hypothetical protein
MVGIVLLSSPIDDIARIGDRPCWKQYYDSIERAQRERVGPLASHIDAFAALPAQDRLRPG